MLKTVIQQYQRQRHQQIVMLPYQLMYFSSAPQKIRKGLYAGSFDPPSNGHLDIIQRGISLCDKLYVGVATNAMKKPIFNLEQRINFLKKITAKHEDKIEIAQVDGLLVDFCEENDVDFMIRGIRSYADFDSEFSMGIINRKLSGKETVFLMASSSRVHISSTRIRELAMFGRKLENFVPDQIEEEVYAQLFEHYKKNGLVQPNIKVKANHHQYDA